jgi:excisionase family DNA binding protein
MNTEWLTITEAAEYIGVSDDTIRRRLADGSFEGKRIGPRLIRIHQSELDRWIESSVLR